MDSFDDIQCEEADGYEAYQAQLELQQYLESDQFLEELNQELREISEREQGVDYEWI